jgi:DNA-binding transcriptional LysR family regulator
MERIDLNKAATFVRIVEAGGVTAAATKLKLPKSSVSRRLTQLEHELGVQLVLRSSREFRLTDAGRAFFEAASRGIAALEEASDDLRAHQHEPRGLVRIVAPPDFGISLVAPIAAIARAHPGLQIELSLSSRQADPIRDGFDLAVCIGKLSDSSLIARTLGIIDSGIFASPAYLASRGTPRAPADLAAHDCVLHRSAGKKARWELTGPGGAVSVEVTGQLRVDDRFAAASALMAGAGLGVLPLHLLASWGPSPPSLVRVLEDYVVPGEPAQIIYPASRHMPRRVSLVCDGLLAAVSTQCPRAARAREQARAAPSGRRPARSRGRSDASDRPAPRK